MGKQNPGAAFERRLLASFRNSFPRCWAHKNPTMNTRGGYANDQPPDIIVVGDGFNLLVECKAVKGPSMPFSRLAPHQEEHLLAFDDTHATSYGVVGVLQYNGQRGSMRVYDAWLIPILEWTSLRDSAGRKSLPLHGKIRDYIAPWHCPWKSPVFDVSAAVSNLRG